MVTVYAIGLVRNLWPHLQGCFWSAFWSFVWQPLQHSFNGIWVVRVLHPACMCLWCGISSYQTPCYQANFFCGWFQLCVTLQVMCHMPTSFHHLCALALVQPTSIVMLSILIMTMMYLFPHFNLVGNCPVWSENIVSRMLYTTDVVYHGVYIPHFLFL